MTSEKTYHFIAISGSLRKGSFNTFALQATQQLAPENITVEQVDISEIPLYNTDIHAAAYPEAAEQLAQKIIASNGLLIVSPEYNYSIPGGLKNVIDVLSRHPAKPLDRKAVAIMGASIGTLGTARMQYHLRQVLVCLNANVVNKPEIMISSAQQKFNEEGVLTDETVSKQIPVLLHALAALSDKH